MNTTFSEMIDRLTATTPEQEDYTGEDGLLYCGKCRKPKEAYFCLLYTSDAADEL